MLCLIDLTDKQSEYNLMRSIFVQIFQFSSYAMLLIDDLHFLLI